MVVANKLSAGQGETLVELEYQFVGQDLQVLLTAGKAHVGAVALAVPCAKTAEGVTASVSVMTVPGHRDNVVAGDAALMLCKALGRPVSVTAGLHIDQANGVVIQELITNADEAVNKLVNLILGDEK